MSAVDASTASTRTFPNLSSLTKNSGDLLIAIVFGYQSTASAGAVWSSWGGGFTEFGDYSSTTTCTIGLAYKWSTGSETGTFTVTQASAITGHAAMILLSIPGAHATTPPEAVGSATGSAASIDPPSLNPANWDVADTLWIAVGGLGETSTSGAWDGISSGPSGYSDYFETGVTGDAVGAVELAVAFLQSAVASVNPGTFTNDSSNTRYRAATIGIRPAPSSYNGTATESYTATITTTGKATYKGQATNTYTAAVTTSGVASAPKRGVVTWAQMHVPKGTAYGTTTTTYTAAVTTQGTRLTHGTATNTYTVATTTTGKPTYKGVATNTYTAAITTAGRLVFYGQSSVSETASITTSGSRTTKGTSVVSETATITTSGTRTALSQSSVAETAAITTSGIATYFAQSTFTETVAITTDGSVGAGVKRGVVAWASFSVPKAAIAGQVTTTYTAGITTSGTPTALSQSTFTETVAITTSGAKTTHGESTVSETVTITTQGAGAGEHFGTSSVSETVAIVTAGNVTKRSGVVAWASLSVPVFVATTYYGESSVAETVTINTDGDIPGANNRRARVAFAAFAVPHAVQSFTSSSSLTETVAIKTRAGYGYGLYGRFSYKGSGAAETLYGTTSLALTDSITTSATRTTHSVVSTALTDSITTQGRRVYFSRVRVGNKTPFTLPGTASQSNGGQAAWTNIDNIKADDGSVASVTVTNQSENLFATGLGLDVHGDVRKVFVEVEANVGAGAILRVQLTKSASYEANDYQEIIGPFSGTTTLDFHPYTLGEPDSFWINTGLTPTEAEGSGFGVDFYVQRSSGTPTVTIDYVKVRVVSTIEDLVTSLGSIGQYGQVSTSETVGITTSGKVTAKSQSSVAESATITTSGSKTTHSTSSVSEVVTITTSGQLTHFTWYGIASTNLTVGSTTTGTPNFKGLVTTSGNVTITTVANILAHAQVSAAFLLNIRTRPQSLVFLTEADCADLIALAEECDDLSMNGASDSQLALVGAEDT